MQIYNRERVREIDFLCLYLATYNATTRLLVIFFKLQVPVRVSLLQRCSEKCVLAVSPDRLVPVEKSDARYDYVNTCSIYIELYIPTI